MSQILTRERMRDFVRRKEVGGGIQMSSLQRCGKSLAVLTPELGPGIYQLHDLGLDT